MVSSGGCPSGKFRYTNKLGARMALAKLRQARTGDRCERSWYFCLICKGYHLTGSKHSNKRS